MATQLQIRRGTTLENNAFTGAVGEITMDTDTNSIRIHDGNTLGGIQIPSAQTADYVVEWQAPTDLNNYTWYRKYKSGWIEQGGYGISDSSGTITLPVEMADTRYYIVFGGDGMSSNNNTVVVVGYNKTTTGFTIQSNVLNNAGSSAATRSSGSSWRVSGMSA